MSFVIKGKNKFLLYEEEDNAVSLNLIQDKSMATQYGTREEAKGVLDELVKEVGRIADRRTEEKSRSYSKEEILEQESMLDFSNLTIIELK